MPIPISSLGARKDINAAAHSYDAAVLHDVINNNMRTRRSRKVLMA